MRRLLIAAVTASAQVIAPDASRLPESALPSPDWPAQPADDDKAPAVGGRVAQRYRVARPAAVLASFDTVARATFSAQASDFSDIAGDPLYGGTRLT